MQRPGALPRFSSASLHTPKPKQAGKISFTPSSSLQLLCAHSVRPPSLPLLASAASLQQSSGSSSVASYYSPMVFYLHIFPWSSNFMPWHVSVLTSPARLLTSFPTVRPRLTTLQPHGPSSHTHWALSCQNICKYLLLFLKFIIPDLYMTGFFPSWSQFESYLQTAISKVHPSEWRKWNPLALLVGV